MDYNGMWWLWTLALCPRLGLQAENSSQTKQIPTSQGGFASRTLQESETDWMRVTENGTDPSSGSWGASTTPAFPVLKSSPEYKMNADEPAAPRQGSSAPFWIPPVVAFVLLAGLFLMYRRKRGRESRSRAASINASSESDSEDKPAVEQAMQLNPPEEPVQQNPKETLQSTEALSPVTDEEDGSAPDSRRACVSP